MKFGYVKAAAGTPRVKVADCGYNKNEIIRIIDEASENKAKLIILPELCITGYTCGDLFLQKTLADSAMKYMLEVAEHTRGKDALVAAGMPLNVKNRMYNVAAVMFDGRIIAFIPKENIPVHAEFYEARHFAKGRGEITEVLADGRMIPFGTDILITADNMPGFTVGFEICEDLWVPLPPGVRHALAGAGIIANLSASNESTGKDIYREDLVKGQSARLFCGYIYASAGEGESTTDLVFSGHNIIAENGIILKASKRFGAETIYADIDLEKIFNERRRMTTYECEKPEKHLELFISFKDTGDVSSRGYVFDRHIQRHPFVPSDRAGMNKRCEEILTIQAMGLKKRLQHTRAKSAVIGISGGLDSALALIVTARAFDMLNKDRRDIVAVTMPGFGTTDRTYDNAVNLIRRLRAAFYEINIGDAVLEHFRAIGHDADRHDITYENAQARQRTMILMDLANKYGGMVIGTGDMSELALGWATYNGDHMSGYGVNCSIPKTLVRYLVKYYADNCGDGALSEILYDVLNTPVSPELIPPSNGIISQNTEDIVGPYELHDFFLYYMLRFGFKPEKIYFLACKAFEGVYEKEIILKWIKVFYGRFFSQQFKRSCIPDGPKVGSVALSPRGDLRMPSDACSREWLEEIERICIY